MLFKLSNLNSNLALALGYLNPPLNNSAQLYQLRLRAFTLYQIDFFCAGVALYRKGILFTLKNRAISLAK